MDKKEMLYLIDKYLAGEASPEEISLLHSYYSTFQDNQNWNETELGDKNEMEVKLLSKITEQLEQENRKVRTIRRDMVRKIAIAASVVAILGLATFLYVSRSNKKLLVSTNEKPVRFRNEVLPGGNKAVLTLNDGSSIILDDANDGTLAQQGTTRIIKIGGKLSYNSTGKEESEIGFNTISTPRGGQYRVELPDGTMAWLNAESTLKFPTSFKGKERKVEINGEVYFEVAHNKNMPFLVKMEDAEIQVLGTHFNVMAYTDEEAIKTTLLEGAVKFSHGKIESTLKPGQQSQLLKSGEVKILNAVDIEQTVAWKNGFFVFDNYNLATVMRQLSRWYDVTVEYKNPHNKSVFIGEMPRSSKLSDVLKVLELTGNIRFEIEGKKIIVN